jgi:Fe-S cluster biogenesis protein NfuA
MYAMSKAPPVSHDKPDAAAPSAPDVTSASFRAGVQQVLDLIRPAVQSDGGDVELVEVGADGVVLVRLHGACVGCPSSNITLQTGIERSLKQRVPGVTAVRAVS